MDCLGATFTNKYSEDQPKARYHGDDEVIGEIGKPL